MATKQTELLIPVKKQRSLPGNFSFPAKANLISSRDVDLLPLTQLATDLKTRLKIKASVNFNATGNGNVVLQRSPVIKKKEAYRLTITKDNINLMASTDQGMYYGIQTLRDLTTIHGRTIPCCQIDDFPDFKRRAIYFDVARGRVPKIDTVKELIERLSRWKINELQLYIKNTFTWAKHPAIGKGFSQYTPEDILEIQAYCKLHYISFVPSLATLSHNELTLQLPEYANLAELPGYNGWEGGTMLCPTDPKSFKLTKELHDEFFPLFESTDINLCCDEPWELGQGRSKRTADRIGRGQVYLNFLLKLHKNCEKLGKRMNIWGDIVLKYPELLKDMPKDVVMLNWDYETNGSLIPRTKEFVDAELPVMACPGTGSWQTHGTRLQNAIGNVSNFARTAKKYNIEGILNTDWGDFGHRNPLGVSLHGYAHGAAHSWHTKGVDDNNFTKTFAAHFFNDDGKTAEAITTLGNISTQASTNPHILYHLLVEPAKLPVTRFIKRFNPVPIVAHYPAHYNNHIDTVDIDKLQAVISSLSDKSLWPEPDKNLPEFEQLALADYRLATSMDTLAAERGILGVAYRLKSPLPKTEYTQWADAMDNLMLGFQGLWELRYLPSRLKDNLRLMRMAASEYRQIGK